MEQDFNSSEESSYQEPVSQQETEPQQEEFHRPAAQTNESSGQCADAFGVPETREKSSGAPETSISARMPKCGPLPKQSFSRISPKAPVRLGHLRTDRKNRTNNKRLKR